MILKCVCHPLLLALFLDFVSLLIPGLLTDCIREAMTSTRLVLLHTLWVPKYFQISNLSCLKLRILQFKSAVRCGTKEIAKGDTVMTV